MILQNIYSGPLTWDSYFCFYYPSWSLCSRYTECFMAGTSQIYHFLSPIYQFLLLDQLCLRFFLPRLVSYWCFHLQFPFAYLEFPSSRYHYFMFSLLVLFPLSLLEQFYSLLFFLMALLVLFKCLFVCLFYYFLLLFLFFFCFVFWIFF